MAEIIAKSGSMYLATLESVKYTKMDTRITKTQPKASRHVSRRPWLFGIPRGLRLVCEDNCSSPSFASCELFLKIDNAYLIVSFGNLPYFF